MKKEELKALIDKHTANGVLNVEELNKDINAAFDNVIEKKVSATLEGVDVSGHKAAGVSEFLKKHEFDNEESFDVFVTNAKQGETDLSKKATRLETENGTLKTKKGELEGQITTLAQSKTKLERQLSAITCGKVAPEFVEFVVDKVGKSLGEGEDFDEALESFIEKNPQYGMTGHGNIGQPAGGREAPIKNPWAKETRNIAEQTRLFRENPAKARELAKQAGVKI